MHVSFGFLKVVLKFCVFFSRVLFVFLFSLAFFSTKRALNRSVLNEIEP